MVFRWADPKASQTVVLVVDGSVVQTDAGLAVLMDDHSVEQTAVAWAATMAALKVVNSVC